MGKSTLWTESESACTNEYGHVLHEDMIHDEMNECREENC